MCACVYHWERKGGMENVCKSVEDGRVSSLVACSPPSPSNACSTVFTRTPGGVNVSDSDLCCCVPCLSSAIISLCWLGFVEQSKKLSGARNLTDVSWSYFFCHFRSFFIPSVSLRLHPFSFCLSVRQSVSVPRLSF